MASEENDCGFKVAEAILRTRSIGHAVIEVKASGSMITLEGSVGCKQDRRVAGEIAQAQSGVTAVNNELSISAP